LSPVTKAFIVVFVLAAAGGGFFWWQKRHTIAAPPALTSPTPVPAPAPQLTPAVPGVQHPIANPPAAGLPSLAESDPYIERALADLLGRRSLHFLRLDGFVHRLVASTDNLTSDPAPTLMWPVAPTGGRFETEPQAGGSVIAPRNSERYAPFVRFVAELDSQRVVELYRRLYPLFQKAYEDLGYPGKYFNDRVVEVVDHLLATPDLAEPLRVKRVQLEGAPRPVDASGLYQFEDPALEARSAGQKILLRVGRANAAILKRKLSEIRPLIATARGQR
jgi:hypothetical protein